MSLEILQHLLLARVTAVALMGAIWSNLLTHELQIKAILAAITYHGGFELVRAWRGRVHRRERQRDRRVILWLLFLVRVFIWGAAFAASSSLASSNPSATLFAAAQTAATTVGALVVYCEAVEVLVLLYFADGDVPYRWRRRALLWRFAASVGVSDACGILPLVAQALAVRIAPLVLLSALLVVLAAALELPWHRIATRYRQQRRMRSNSDRRVASPKRPQQSQMLGGGGGGNDDSNDTEELSDEPPFVDAIAAAAGVGTQPLEDARGAWRHRR